MHVCSNCGLFAVANLKKNQFHCPACKNTTGIVQARAHSARLCRPPSKKLGPAPCHPILIFGLRGLCS